MSPVQTCPNCPPSAGTRTVFTSKHGVRGLQCLGCGLQFAETYPEIEDADTGIYGDRYFAGAIEKRQAREKTFEALLGEVASVLGRTGRLLDVGCGEGLLVEVAARMGWEAEGTEIAGTAVRYAREERGLTVHQGVIEDVPLETGSCDAIVLNHVLEHVQNPRRTLESVRELLAPDGVVRIEVPNLAGLASRAKNLQSRLRLKGEPWKHYDTGHHFWFFTPPTLTQTVVAAGMSVVRLEAPAVQWGRHSVLDRAANGVYAVTLWGGHLVAYARG